MGGVVSWLVCLHWSGCTSECFSLLSSPCSTLLHRPATVTTIKLSSMLDKTRHREREYSFNRRPGEGANQRPLVSTYGIEVGIYYCTTSRRSLVVCTIFHKLRVTAFIWYTGYPHCTLWKGVPTWSLDLIFYALPKFFLPSTNRAKL